MLSYTFDNLISSLDENGFTDDTVDTIKTTIQAAGRISSAQVVQLLKFISYDDAKLDVAKMAYHYAVDPISYASVVGAAFSYSDSKTKLNEYIRQQ